MNVTQYSLVADIGGTNARFALVGPEGNALLDVRYLVCAEYPSLTEAIQDYLQTASFRPDRGVISIAAPITGEDLSMTNHHWRFNIGEICETLGWQSLQVINDYTALALAVGVLDSEHCVAIGGGSILPGYPVAIIGPGTGLGVAGAVPQGNAWMPIESQGGHVCYGPQTVEEARVLESIGERVSPITAETLVSGPGISLLYEAMTRIESGVSKHISPAEVSRLANENDPQAFKALSMFCDVLGTVAGDLALTMGARGGVYICGGIAPRMIKFIKASGFRQRFEQHGKMSGYLQKIPVFVVTEDSPGLIGTMQALRAEYRALGVTSYNSKKI